MQRLSLAATGHRTSYLPTARLFRIARACLLHLSPDEVVSGMALGWDTAVALAAVDLGLPLVAAVPGSISWQHRGWTPHQIARHHRLLGAAALVQEIGLGYTATRAYGLRDRYMVDRADLVVAWWSGRPSGTGNTVRYADQRGVLVVNLYGLQ